MVIYESENDTYYLKKNEIPKNFDPIFNHEGVLKTIECQCTFFIDNRLNFLNIKSDFR